MLSTQMMKLAERNQWRPGSDESFIFGEFNGYLFTVMEGKGFVAFITPLAGISKGALDSLVSFLQKNLRTLRLRNYEISDNFLCVRMQEGLFSVPVEKMEYLLAEISGLLSLSEMPNSACVVCGKPAQKRGLYYGLFCHLHPECQDNEMVDYTGTDYAAADMDGEGPAFKLADEELEAEAAGSADAGSAPVSGSEPADSSSATMEAALSDEKDRENLARKLSELSGTMAGYKSEMIASLVNICRIPSVRGPATGTAPFGEETALALDAFLSLAQRLGFQTANLDNYAGTVEFGEGDPLTAVLVHLDVVPAGANWTTDPFDPVIENDRFICRGALDDKGPAVAALYAMKALKDEGFSPEGRIRLIVGLDEEVGFECMAHYVKVAELPAAGFTPDGNFPVVYAEKGCLWLNVTIPSAQSPDDYLRLVSAHAGDAPNMVPADGSLVIAGGAGSQEFHVKGKSAHGSTPWLGQNAITQIVQETYDRLSAAGSRHPFVSFYREFIHDSWRGDGFGINGEDESGMLTMNAGMLDLDEEKAILTLDIRYPVTWNADFLIQKIQEKAGAYGGSAAVIRNIPPLHVPKESTLVSTLHATFCDLTGLRVPPLALGGGTYARTMPNVVAFGPVYVDENESAHQAGEYISIPEFLAMAAIFREALRRLAGRKDDQPDAQA